MEDYFTETQSKFKSNNFGNLNIVMGNESCDLDSSVSSLVYALFLHWQYQQMKCKVCTRTNRDESTYKDDIFIFMLNVDREDYELKTEVAYFFRKNGIKDDQIIFRNDHDLEQLVANNKTNVTIVDHHVLSANDQFIAPYVTEIIDHHILDKSCWKFSDDTRSTVETVGSCCTLIVQRIKDLTALMSKNGDFFEDFPICSYMLHGTIILDTVNFSKDLNKGTPHDEQIVLFLETKLQPSDSEQARKNILEDLTRARSNVSSLTAAQLLRKDAKRFGDILVPSFPILVLEFLKKPNVIEALDEALTKRECCTTVLLGMDLKEGMKRDVAIYASEKKKAEQLSTFLEQWKKPPLYLTPCTPPVPGCHYYKQANLSATRKQYVPAVTEFLNKS